MPPENRAEFRNQIYAMVCRIPAGKVMGYGHVAAALGIPRAARQVGKALSTLPTENAVPWQRVVRSSGEIAGQGDPGRPAMQRFLLEMEGIVFVRGRINMAAYGWMPSEEERG